MAKTLILISLALFTTYYVIFITWVRIGLLKLRLNKKNHGSEPFVSVIVPARNEQEKIRDCLQSLINQAYPANKYEIIVVDDGSTDDTAVIVEKFARKYSNIKLLSKKEHKISGSKTLALSYGIENAKGEIILTTDADCSVSTEWVKTMVSYFSENVALVAGPVLEESNGTFISNLESIEVLGLITVAAGLIGAGTPIICNGANLAYRKSAFYKVGGFNHRSQNDDENLMNKIKIARAGHVTFALSPNAVVRTYSSNSILSFLTQRIRWANKRRHYKSIPIFLSLIALYMFFLSLLVTFIMGFFETEFFIPAGIVFLGKVVIEYSTLRAGTNLFNSKFKRRYFLIAELFHVPYIVITALIAQIIPINWKQRKIV